MNGLYRSIPGSCGAVAHSVGIFAHDVGLDVFGAGCIIAHAFNARIHRAHDIGVGSVAKLFVLHGACIVAALDPFISGDEVVAVTAFVTKAPGDYTGVVLVAFNHCIFAVEYAVAPLGQVAGCMSRFWLHTP